MRTEKTRAQPYPDTMWEVHDETTDLVTRLFRVFAERREPVARIKYLLNRLLQAMEAHAANDGAYERNGGEAEPMEGGLNIRREEHAALIERLRQFMTTIEPGNLEPDEWERLEREFREFGTLWCQHYWNETLKAQPEPHARPHLDPAAFATVRRLRK